MKAKIISRIFIFALTAFMFTAYIHAEEIDKRGVLDEEAREGYYSSRTRMPIVWNPDRYFVTDGKKSWIEDEEGNDQAVVNYYIYPVDDEYGVFCMSGNWSLGEFTLIGRNGEFGRDIYKYPIVTAIKFENFHIIALTEEDNNTIRDVSDMTFFDTDGNKIDDVYKYIADKGAKPADGIYYDSWHKADTVSFLVKPEDIPAKAGVPDKYPYIPAKERVPVGSRGHYYFSYRYARNEGDLYGYVIEDADGKDVYHWGSEPQIDMFAGSSSQLISKKYEVRLYHSYEKDYNAYTVYDVDGNVVASSVNTKTPCLIDFGEFYVIRIPEGWHKPDFEYYSMEGEPIADIDAYLTRHNKKRTDGIYDVSYDTDAKKGGLRDDAQVFCQEPPKYTVIGLQNGRTIVTNGVDMSWLEQQGSQSGIDLTEIIKGKLSMLHYAAGVYLIEYPDGSMELMNEQFKKFGKGSFDVCVLDLDGAYYIAESPKGVSAYDKTQTVYYDSDGNIFTPEAIREKNGKDITAAVKTSDADEKLALVGRWDRPWDKVISYDPYLVDARQYPTRIKVTDDVYIAGQSGEKVWLEHENGEDWDGAHNRYSDLEPIGTDPLLFRAVIENNGEKQYVGLRAVWLQELLHTAFWDFGTEAKYNYFHSLRYGDEIIYTGSTEDVSPFDTAKTTYYVAGENNSLTVSDNIEAYLKSKGLKLSDFVQNTVPETKTVPVAETYLFVQNTVPETKTVPVAETYLTVDNNN